MSIANGVATVLPAPGGYVVDLDHPRTHTDVVTYWIVAAGNALALLFIGQRWYTKIALLKEFRLEDVCLVFAWFASIGTQAVLVYMFAAELLGVRMWELSVSQYSLYNVLILVVPLIYTHCAGLAKLSLLLYYRQLSPRAWFRRAVIATIVVVLGYTLGAFFSLLFGCNPIAKSWDPTVTGGACINHGALYSATAIFNITTNTVILVLPIPAIMGMRVPNLQKAGLVVMFVVGGLTVAASVMRLVVLLTALKDKDQPWAMACPAMWTCVEANLLIICGAFPTLRRFFQSIAPGFVGLDEDARERLTPSPRPRMHAKGKGRQQRHFYNRFHDDSPDYPMRSLHDVDLRPDQIQMVETRAGANSRCSRMWEARPYKSDGDSEKAIFQTRTMTVTYQTRDGNIV
ncbi:hypothetical protein PG993_008553 [Apiospora rasikravindrae]|uniref:Rhodopsin domain-containing protein n=1 Tax=Apiospora rasikravindrae TaxID=990691 RepID=A0ABR1T0N6_9PEZI